MSASTPIAVPRDRYVAFAFAGSDLLIETSPDGVISFAAGAFRLRLGREPERFVDRRICDLIAPMDHMRLAIALAGVAERGRIAPMVLRLNDSARTLVTVSAMMVPGSPPRLCCTLGPVPLPATDHGAGSGNFAREAEARLRVAASGEIALLEVSGWAAAHEAMSGEEQRALRAEIESAIGGGSSDVLAGEIADGRFGVLTPGSADLASIVARLEKLLRASPAARHAKVDGARLPLSAGSFNPSQAVRALRYALSQFASGGAKAARAIGSSTGLEGVIAQAEGRARGLRTVIAERRFRLKFQPVVALADRSVHHYEALLRPFNAPQAPQQSTQDFIIFTEAVGLSEELDYAVTDVALAALRGATAASVAVNISGLSIQSVGFVERFLALVADAGVLASSGRLLVELTETAEIDAMATAAANIDRIRAAGVPVCLDDFGVGAAAFSYLREFTVDLVKIDGLYVHRATIGPRERGLVASMVELAATAGAKVVVETIETEEQAELMQSLGATFGQGWLFGRPGLLPGAPR
jgi:EAL domain-containing protein (putative c-di-GMP-specific phosphodiesterase class I)